MNGNCDVIRDLLPLYRDGVCSPASRALVEAHLKECAECRKALESIEAEMQVSTPEMEESFRAWQKLQRKIMRRRLKKIAAIVLALAIAVAGCMFVRDIYEFGLKPLDVDDIEITALYRLSDGRIYMAMQGTEHNLASSISGTEEMEADVTEGGGAFVVEPFWTRYDDRQLYYNRIEFDFVVPAEEHWSMDGVKYSFTTQTVEIICGDERRLICEFDDELPAAPPEIEVRAQWISDPVNG